MPNLPASNCGHVGCRFPSNTHTQLPRIVGHQSGCNLAFQDAYAGCDGRAWSDLAPVWAQCIPCRLPMQTSATISSACSPSGAHDPATLVRFQHNMPGRHKAAKTLSVFDGTECHAGGTGCPKSKPLALQRLAIA